MDKNRLLLIITLCWLVSIGLFIRVWGLWEYQLSPDEYLSLLVSRGETFSQLWESASFHAHPPLQYLILHYLMELSRNAIFLKSISIIPGLGLIIVFFFLGKKVSGVYSGISMAFLATFSFAAILLSEVIRPYSILLLFLSTALWFFFSYIMNSDKKYLYGYIFFMILAINSHYSAVIPVTASSAVLVIRMAMKKKTLREYFKIFVIHLPLIFIIGMLYIFHVSHLMNNPDLQETLIEGYLQTYYPLNLLEWIYNLYDFIGYLFLPPNAAWIIILTMLGCVALWKTSRIDILAVIILTSIINITLVAIKKYPFGGTRQSIYLLPMVALLVGASIQYVVDSAANALRQFNLRGKYLWIETHKDIILKTVFICLIASTLILTLAFKKSEYLRRYRGPSWAEFPLKRDPYAKAMDYLRNKVEQSDIILSNHQTVQYLIFESRQTHKPDAEQLFKISHQGLDYYYINRFKYETFEQLWEAFHILSKNMELKESQRIWLVNIGWGSAEKDFSKDPFYLAMIEEKSIQNGATVFAFKTSSVLLELNKRYKTEKKGG
jgi:hypothetical protein